MKKITGDNPLVLDFSDPDWPMIISLSDIYKVIPSESSLLVYANALLLEVGEVASGSASKWQFVKFVASDSSANLRWTKNELTSGVWRTSEEVSSNNGGALELMVSSGRFT